MKMGGILIGVVCKLHLDSRAGLSYHMVGEISNADLVRNRGVHSRPHAACSGANRRMKTELGTIFMVGSVRF
jgi:hypothetical protein